MSSLKEQILAQANGTPQARTPAGFRPGVADFFASLWITHTPATEDRTASFYMTGRIGNARLFIAPIKWEKTNDKQPDYTSSLSEPYTDEHKQAGTKPPSIRWNGFWDETTRDGSTHYLSSILVAPTLQSTGTILEFWPNRGKTPGDQRPDMIGRVRTMPKLQPRPNGTPATATDERPPAADAPPPAEDFQVPDHTGVPTAGTAVGAEEAIPF